MLANNSDRVVALDSSTQIRLLSDSGKSIQPINNRLSYANFVIFSHDDTLIWGGGEKGSDTGIILHGDRVICRRHRAKPTACRILQSGNSEHALAEIWSFWSDNTLIRTNGENHQAFNLGDVSGVNDFIVIADSPPEVTDWRGGRLVIVGGSNPTLASFRISSKPAEGKTLLAVAAASAITSAVSSFARRWLLDEDGKKLEHSNDDEEEDDKVTVWPFARFEDDQREVGRLVRGTSLCAASDSFGRVLVFDPLTLQIVRVLKGYRDAQVCFQTVGVESHRHDLLVVFAPLSRGNRLELWPIRGGGAEDPFAYAQVEADQLVSSTDGSSAALITESKLISKVDVSGFDPKELEWNTFFVDAKRALDNDDDLSDIQFTRDMLDKGDLVLRRLLSIEAQSTNSFGIEFYLNFLRLQKRSLEEKSESITEIDAKIDILMAFKTMMGSVKGKSITSVVEKDASNPRRWALEVANEKGSAVSMNLVTEKSAALLVSSKDEDNIRKASAFLDFLLFGDVFLVRQLAQILSTHFSSSPDAVRLAFTFWWITRPVELSSSWRNSSASSNSALKMALDLGVKAADISIYQPKGRLQLARAALFAYAMSKLANGEGEKQEFDNLVERFSRSFRIAVLLDSDDVDIRRVESDETFILKQACERCVVYKAAQREQGLVVPTQRLFTDDNVKDDKGERKMWERPQYPFTELQSILKKTDFSSMEARDKFRIMVAQRALSLNDFGTAMVAARELEDPSILVSIARTATKMINEEPPCDVALARLLMFAWKDTTVKRNAVNALVLAGEILAIEAYTSIREFLISDELEDENIKKVIHDLYRERLRRDETIKMDDEALRAQARALGIEDAPQMIALWHYRAARDVRGNEGFDAIADDQAKLATAVEALRLCRIRLADILRSARNDASKASLLASLPPKTASWLLSMPASDEPVTPAPLKSTLSVLKKIEGTLPRDKTPNSGSTVTPQERCSQMQTLVETMIDAAENGR